MVRQSWGTRQPGGWRQRRAAAASAEPVTYSWTDLGFAIAGRLFFPVRAPPTGFEPVAARFIRMTRGATPSVSVRRGRARTVPGRSESRSAGSDGRAAPAAGRTRRPGGRSGRARRRRRRWGQGSGPRAVKGHADLNGGGRENTSCEPGWPRSPGATSTAAASSASPQECSYTRIASTTPSQPRCAPTRTGPSPPRSYGKPSSTPATPHPGSGT